MKHRTTASVQSELADKLADLARRSGLSQSQLLNLCLRYSLSERAPSPVVEARVAPPPPVVPFPATQSAVRNSFKIDPRPTA